MPRDVVCRICKGKFMETNDEDGWIKVNGGSIPDPRHRAYNPNAIANGAMIRLKPEYEKLMWSPSFTHDVTQTGDALECPSCGCPYPDLNGKIITVDQPVAKRSHGGRPRKEAVNG